MVTKKDIENEMEEVQEMLKQRTVITKLAVPLPSVPSGPNIARTSDDMWKIYQFKRARYDRLQSLPTEQDFLVQLLDQIRCHPVDMGPFPVGCLKERLADLRERERVDVPCVEIPLTRIPVLTWEEKVAKAKLIAQHLSAEQQVTNPESTMDEIAKLQNRLMELEEAYLDADSDLDS